MARAIITRTNLSMDEILMLHNLLLRKVVSTKQMAYITSQFDIPLSARNTHRLLNRFEQLKLVKSKWHIASKDNHGYRAKLWRITKLGIARIILNENESYRLRKFWRDSFPNQSVPHILAVNDTEMELGVPVEREPECWRKFRNGSSIYDKDEWLKPDLFANINGKWRFIEVDMGSERSSRVIEKCKLYLSYFERTMNVEWKDHLPRTIWVVQNDARQRLLLTKFKEKLPKHWQLFPCALLSEIESVL